MSPDETNGESQDEELAEHRDDEDEGFSLEELGAAYKHVTGLEDQVLQREHLEAARQASETVEPDEDEVAAELAEAFSETDDEESVASPEAIIEAALFVGHPENQSVTSTRLASIMRDMTAEEVEDLVEQLNQSYKDEGQGIRIALDEDGYKMVVAPEVENVRTAFRGKSARLS